MKLVVGLGALAAWHLMQPRPGAARDAALCLLLATAALTDSRLVGTISTCLLLVAVTIGIGTTICGTYFWRTAAPPLQPPNRTTRRLHLVV